MENVSFQDLTPKLLKWGVDYVMVKYEYEEQVSAYDWLERNKDKNPEAFKRASNKWGNDYVMVKYEYEK